MSTPYLGTIMMFGGNFTINGWAQCNGQLLPINQYSALFSLLGTTYGGDGQTTFALPNLQSRIPVGYGNGAGLSPYVLGQSGGTPSVTLTSAQLPGHSHLADGASVVTNSSGNPTNNVPGTVGGRGGVLYKSGAFTPAVLTGLSQSGGNQPHDNQQPFLAVTFLIALEGIFPSQN